MKNESKINYNERSRILKAMAHPTRLFILEELSKSELCVSEITAMIDADVSTVSKHLSILRNAGLVYDEKRGNCVYYNLRVPCVLDFMSCIEAVIEESAGRSMKVLSCCVKANINKSEA